MHRSRDSDGLVQASKIKSFFSRLYARVEHIGLFRSYDRHDDRISVSALIEFKLLDTKLMNCLANPNHPAIYRSPFNETPVGVPNFSVLALDKPEWKRNLHSEEDYKIVWINTKDGISLAILLPMVAHSKFRKVFFFDRGVFKLSNNCYYAVARPGTRMKIKIDKRNGEQSC